jgi:hypothetical protein
VDFHLKRSDCDTFPGVCCRQIWLLLGIGRVLLGSYKVFIGCFIVNLANFEAIAFVEYSIFGTLQVFLAVFSRF